MPQDYVGLSKDLEELVSEETKKSKIREIISQHLFGIKFSAITDIGKRREINEDSISIDPIKGVFVIADGMGGHDSGEVASRIAVDTILEKYDPNSPQKSLNAALIEAHNIIKKENENKEDRKSKMGTTLTAAAISDDILYTAHIGDSKIYLIRKDKIEQLTKDHTLVGEMMEEFGYSQEKATKVFLDTETHKIMDEDKLQEDEARKVAKKNMLSIVTQALGHEDILEIESREIPLFKDDYILICSDGLTKMIEKEDLIDLNTLKNTILNDGNDLRQTTNKLISIANEAGGKDNISVILIKKEKGPKYSPRITTDEGMDSIAESSFSMGDEEINHAINGSKKKENLQERHDDGVLLEHEIRDDEAGKDEVLDRLLEEDLTPKESEALSLIKEKQPETKIIQDQPLKLETTQIIKNKNHFKDKIKSIFKTLLIPSALLAATAGIGYFAYNSAKTEIKPNIQKEFILPPPVIEQFEENKFIENDLTKLPRRKALITKDILHKIKNLEGVIIPNDEKTYVEFEVPIKHKDDVTVYAFFDNNPHEGKVYSSQVENKKAKFAMEYSDSPLNVIVINKNNIQTASWKYNLDLELNSQKQIEDNKSIKKQHGDTPETDKVFKTYLDYYKIKPHEVTEDVKVSYDKSLEKLVGYRNENKTKEIKTDKDISWVKSELMYDALRTATLKGNKINKFDINIAPKKMIEEMLYSNKPTTKLAKELTNRYNIHISRSTINRYRHNMYLL